MSDMEYRALGQTGVRVSAFGLGTMMFGAWGNPDPAECDRIVGRCLDAGINVVDCADVYSSGEGERILGKALAGRRDNVVLATKFHGRMGSDPNQRGASRRWIIRAVEDSLRRLDVDCIDLYQLHRPEPETRLEDTLRALDDLVTAGKIVMYGVSNFSGEGLVDADWTARSLGLTRPATVQSPYSVFNRAIERGVLPVAEQLGMGVLAFSPLNGGWLTDDKYHSSRAIEDGTRAQRKRIPARFDFTEPGNQAKFELLPALTKAAADESLSLTALALYWAVEHPAVSTALIGPRTEAQTDQLIDIIGAYRPLSQSTLDAVDDLIAPATILNWSDDSYQNPALHKARRRRGHE